MSQYTKGASVSGHSTPMNSVDMVSQPSLLELFRQSTEADQGLSLSEALFGEDDIEKNGLNEIKPDEWRNIPKCITESFKKIVENMMLTNEKLVVLNKGVMKEKTDNTFRLTKVIYKMDDYHKKQDELIKKVETSLDLELNKVKNEVNTNIEHTSLQLQKHISKINSQLTEHAKRMSRFDDATKLKSYTDSKVSELTTEIHNIKFQVHNDVKDQVDEFKKQNLMVEGLVGLNQKYQDLKDFITVIDGKMEEISEGVKNENDINASIIKKMKKKITDFEKTIQNTDTNFNTKIGTLENNLQEIKTLQIKNQEKEQEFHQYKILEKEREIQKNNDDIQNIMATSINRQFDELSKHIACLEDELKSIKDSTEKSICELARESEEIKDNYKKELIKVSNELKDSIYKTTFNPQSSINLSLDELRKLQESRGTNMTSTNRGLETEKNEAEILPPVEEQVELLEEKESESSPKKSTKNADKKNHQLSSLMEGHELEIPKAVDHEEIQEMVEKIVGIEISKFKEEKKKLHEKKEKRKKNIKEKEKKKATIQQKINSDITEKIHKIEFAIENPQLFKINNKRINEYIFDEIESGINNFSRSISELVSKSNLQISKNDKRISKIEEYFKDNSLAIEVTEIKMKDFEELAQRLKNIELELDIKERKVKSPTSSPVGRQFSLRIDSIDSRLQEIESKQNYIEMNLQTRGQSNSRSPTRSLGPHKKAISSTGIIEDLKVKNFDSSIESFSTLRLQETQKDENLIDPNSSIENAKSMDFASGPRRKGIPLNSNIPTVTEEEQSTMREIEKSPKINEKKKQITNIHKVYNKETIHQQAKYQQEFANTYKLPPILNENQITPQALQMLIPKGDDKPISIKYDPIPGLQKFPKSPPSYK